MGKTSLALNIAENVCFKSNIPVGIFSLEMSAEQLVHRIVCSQAEVESDKIKTGALNGIEYQRIVGSVSDMQKHVMIIDDQAGLKNHRSARTCPAHERKLWHWISWSSTICSSFPVRVTNRIGRKPSK